MYYKKYVITGLVCLIIGSTIGIGGTVYYYKKETKIPINKVQVIKITGEDMKVNKVTLRRNSVAVRVDAKGKGTSDIVIQKDTIPEALAWRKKVHGIQVQSGINYNIGFDSMELDFSVMYLYRFNRFAIGVGPKFSVLNINKNVNSIGVNVSAQYWF